MGLERLLSEDNTLLDILLMRLRFNDSHRRHFRILIIERVINEISLGLFHRLILHLRRILFKVLVGGLDISWLSRRPLVFIEGWYRFILRILLGLIDAYVAHFYREGWVHTIILILHRRLLLLWCGLLLYRGWCKRGRCCCKSLHWHLSLLLGWASVWPGRSTIPLRFLLHHNTKRELRLWLAFLSQIFNESVCDWLLIF